MDIQPLQSSAWLAKRLGLAISTIERLRSTGAGELPPCIVIGSSIRYDVNIVEQWLSDRMMNADGTALSANTTGVSDAE